MIIKLEELDNLPEQTLEIFFDEIISDIDSDENVKGDLIVKKTGYGVEVTGTVSVKFDLTCDRCLKNYQQTVDFEIEEQFIEDSLFDEHQSECMVTEFVEELKGREDLDITDLVYQCIILNSPTSRLCDSSCKGTKEVQELKENRIDPRLSVFKDIKIDKK